MPPAPPSPSQLARALARDWRLTVPLFSGPAWPVLSLRRPFAAADLRAVAPLDLAAADLGLSPALSVLRRWGSAARLRGDLPVLCLSVVAMIASRQLRLRRHHDGAVAGQRARNKMVQAARIVDAGEHEPLFSLPPYLGRRCVCYVGA